MKITVLGARGSIPTDGKDMIRFGGATSCIMVETAKNVIFLDAGTGIMKAPVMEGKDVYVLLTHPHADHVIGLPFFSYMMIKDKKIEVLATVKDGLGTYDQLKRLVSEPLWPCTVNDYPAKVICRDITFPIELGDTKILGMESNHPGESTVMRVECDGASFVYATDYEHSEKDDARLIDLCKGTDLLMYDGQYTTDEYEAKAGYGHSTPEHGVRIMKESGAGSLLIVHHDPFHDDAQLEKMEQKIRTDNIAFARQGEVICLPR